MSATMGRRNVVWKTPELTGFWLKIFACVTMLVQTIGIVIVENGLIHISSYTQESFSNALAEDSHLMTLAGVGSVMQLIGGLAMPVFAFLMVEGFKNTSSYRKYLLTVLAFALISEVPYDFAISGRLLDFSSQNALTGMAIALMMLYCLELVSTTKTALRGLVQVLVVLGAVVWVSLLRAQYGLCMVLLVAVFYLFYTRNVLKTLLGAAVSLLYVTGPLAFYPIWFYNGERGYRCSKYVFYAFYPLHLLVLGVITNFFLI